MTYRNYFFFTLWQQISPQAFVSLFTLFKVFLYRKIHLNFFFSLIYWYITNGFSFIMLQWPKLIFLNKKLFHAFNDFIFMLKFLNQSEFILNKEWDKAPLFFFPQMTSLLVQYLLLNKRSFPQCFERPPLSYLKVVHFLLSLASQNRG